MKLNALLSASAASLALFAAAPVLADSEVVMVETASELPSGPEGPALWKVADEDTTIYLFGTVHVLPADLEWYDAEIDAALASADTVVTEVEDSPESEALQQQLAMQLGLSADGSTLRSLLNEEQKAAYEAALGGMKVPPEAFDPFKPWLAALTLSFLPLMQQGYDLESGVESVIGAKAGDKPREALETVEFQLGIFNGMSQEDQVAYMMEIVDNIDEVAPMVGSMVTEWVEGDPDGLAAIMNDGIDETPAIANALLFDRNANWAEWIENRLETTPGTVFMAVGAGHLAGDRSVQDYLAERGIEMVRVQ